MTRGKEAFRVPIACTPAMVTTGLEPAFLALPTSEIQSVIPAFFNLLITFGVEFQFVDDPHDVYPGFVLS
jgi:hypothetical protein